MSKSVAFLDAVGHCIERTSPMGQPFIGKCVRCGAGGLSSIDARSSDCPGPQLTEAEFVDFVTGGERGECN